MNRGRLRRYALRVVAAVSLGAGLAVLAGGVAQATTTPPTVYGKVIPAQHLPGEMVADETTWG
ncbi:MAG: hypothetical protein E6G35_15950 [Actinobacteria bacterium]|nr:MAG: hypothetical protein E6G35_15950 [Actinomycetota bacterium]